TRKHLPPPNDSTKTLNKSEGRHPTGPRRAPQTLRDEAPGTPLELHPFERHRAETGTQKSELVGTRMLDVERPRKAPLEQRIGNELTALRQRGERRCCPPFGFG